MIKTIKVQDLAVGMYITLPISWFKHPFLKNEFMIISQDQIDRIIGHGITEIVIDTEKGDRTDAHLAGGPANVPPKTWTPEKLVPPELRVLFTTKRFRLIKNQSWSTNLRAFLWSGSLRIRRRKTSEKQKKASRKSST